MIIDHIDTGLRRVIFSCYPLRIPAKELLNLIFQVAVSKNGEYGRMNPQREGDEERSRFKMTV